MPPRRGTSALRRTVVTCAPILCSSCTTARSPPQITSSASNQSRGHSTDRFTGGVAMPATSVCEVVCPRYPLRECQSRTDVPVPYTIGKLCVYRSPQHGQG